jgi:hypothetical protein
MPICRRRVETPKATHQKKVEAEADGVALVDEVAVEPEVLQESP